MTEMGKRTEGIIVWVFCFNLFESHSKVWFLLPLRELRSSGILPVVKDARVVGKYCAVFKCCRGVYYILGRGPL